MANIVVKDGAGASKYLKETGAGSDGDPFVPSVNLNSALPAGTAAIGKLAANSGVDIGDVDVTSLPALAAGTNAIGKLAANSGVDIGDVDILSIAAGNNNIGDVDVASIAAGTNVIGKVYIDQTTDGTSNRVAHGGGIVIAQTPTVTAGAYGAKDAVGGKLTFANSVRISGGKSIINSVTLIDLSVAAAALELWLFDRDFTATNDNAAFDPSDADLANCIGVIPITSLDYYVANDNEVAVVRGIGLQFTCAATSIYGQMKCTGTPTYISTGDLTVKLNVQYLD